MRRGSDTVTKRACYLEGIYSHVDEGLQFVLVPLAGVGVGKVDETHSGLLDRDLVSLREDSETRHRDIPRNHTATHFRRTS